MSLALVSAEQAAQASHITAGLAWVVSLLVAGSHDASCCTPPGGRGHPAASSSSTRAMSAPVAAFCHSSRLLMMVTSAP